MITIKRILCETILSVLIFFSISFISVFFQLNSPFNSQFDSTFNIGFPFVYYNQFLVDSPIPNSGWNIKNLVLDFVLIWFVVVGSYTLVFKRHKNRMNSQEK